jgi:hypothetical protein
MAKNNTPLNIPINSLASAFYEGCGKVFKFLGDTITYWVEEGINFFKKTISSIKNAISKLGSAIKRGISWITGFGKWLSNAPVAKVIAGGASIVFGAGKVIGACLKGAYETPAGKFLAAGGAVLVGIVALKEAFVAAVLAPIIIAPIARWLVSSTQTLWEFNWNISDVQIKAQQQAAWEAFSSQLGGELGQATASLICGAVPGVASVRVNPRMLIHMKNELGEEIYENIKSNIWSIARAYSSAQKRVLWLSAYRNARRFIKMLARHNWFREVFGDKAGEAIARWGAPGSQPFIFAEKFENFIELVQDKNKMLGNFLEEYFEEFFDTCGEIFIDWADAVDSFKYP